MTLRTAALLAAALAVATPVAAQAACDSAGGLAFVCGLTNAEDLVPVPGTDWILASGLADGGSSQGHLYLVNTRDHRVETLLPGHVDYRQEKAAFGGCPGAPDEAKFSAHGLSLRASTLYVVHHGERESVEVFALDAESASPRLTWIGCVVAPAGVLANGVAALPDGGFVISNFLDTADPQAMEKLTAGQPEGGLLLWRPDAGWQNVSAAAAISADNGVVASADGKRVFVAGTGDETVVRLSLDHPSERAVVQTGFHTDNLRWGADGFLYAAGQRDTVAHLLACAPNTLERCTGPFSVLRIDPETLETRVVIRHPGTAVFGAASTALRIGGAYWLGTPHGDRIALVSAD